MHAKSRKFRSLLKTNVFATPHFPANSLSPAISKPSLEIAFSHATIKMSFEKHEDWIRSHQHR